MPQITIEQVAELESILPKARNTEDVEAKRIVAYVYHEKPESNGYRYAGLAKQVVNNKGLWGRVRYWYKAETMFSI